MNLMEKYPESLSKDINFLSLKKKYAREIRLLSEVKLSTSLMEIIKDWALIGIVLVLNLISGFPILGPLVSIILIGAVQHGLFMMMHDGAHYRIHNNKTINDLVSDFFLAFPLFMLTDAYRKHHFVHHMHVNTDLDPDLNRKISHKEWQFPMPKKLFFYSFAKYLLGAGIKETLMGLRILSGLNRHYLAQYPLKKIAIRWCFRGMYYLLFIFILHHYSAWGTFALYWIVPYFFVLPILNRLRSIAEHFGLPNKNEVNRSRNVVCSGLEKFFFGPHNICYHLDHHLCPSVPFYNLPKLHKLFLQDKHYCDYAANDTSYLFFGKRPMLRSLVKDLSKSEQFC